MPLRRKAPNATSGQRLLPVDAYRADLDEAALDRVDRRLREQLHSIPVVPGAYLDNEGDRWTLGADNSWTDRYGTTRSSRYTPMLSSFGPFAMETPTVSEVVADG